MWNAKAFNKGKTNGTQKPLTTKEKESGTQKPLTTKEKRKWNASGCKSSLCKNRLAFSKM